MYLFGTFWCSANTNKFQKYMALPHAALVQKCQNCVTPFGVSYIIIINRNQRFSFFLGLYSTSFSQCSLQSAIERQKFALNCKADTTFPVISVLANTLQIDF